MSTKPKLQKYFSRSSVWLSIETRLRELAMSCGLTEEFKWMHPCYTLDGHNIVLIHSFKEYSALMFFKGALLCDPQQILIQQTENVQVGRQLRFTSLTQVHELESTIVSYIREAIEISKSGQIVEMKPTQEFVMPIELVDALSENPELSTAFDRLTPGRQRGYLLYFNSAKQSTTRKARIVQYTPQIMLGRGLKDDYLDTKKK